MIRLAVLAETAAQLEAHLASSAPEEEGAFLLLRAGRGREGTRLLATELLLPPAGAWERKGGDQLRPSAQWISAAVSHAITAGAGLLFMHSHPCPGHPPGLSLIDQQAFQALARTIAPMLDGPFACAVMHPEGWAGGVWDGDGIKAIDSITSVGRVLRPLSPVPRAPEAALDARQRDALGVVQDRLRQLDIAVVGSGGLGSPTAEQLARMGVRRLVLIDHDRLDTESNVRRVIGSVAADLRAAVPPPKVDVVGRHVEQIGLGVPVQRIDGDVRHEEVFRALLDVDVVVCATDTHGSRAVLNDLASAYLLPVIDVGVRVGSKAGGVVAGLLAEVRVLTPTTPCLWCRQTISGDVIRAENLPEEQRRQLEWEGYIVGGVGQPVPSVIALTSLGSGLATCALLSLLSDEGSVAPSGYWVDGMFCDARETEPRDPKSDCWCRGRIGIGDGATPPLLTS